MTDLANHAALTRVRRTWGGLTLAHQFALAAAAVLLAGMLTIGFWVTRQIEEGVTRNTAIATALYVDSVISPLLPNLRDDKPLSAGARRALDETLSQGTLGDRLASFKLWKPDGTIAYSSRPELIGERFEPTDNLREALAGRVAAEFDDLNDEEDALERAAGTPFLEIYSPIREPWSGEVVAVAEFYEAADALRRDLADVRLRSWLVVGLAALGMIACLFGIVLKGSQLIASQRKALEGQVAELSNLLGQNEALRLRVQRASSRSAALNERFLKRISADLHDGPAQLLALASLRLGASTAAAADESPAIRKLLDDAMADIRSICRGLTLPHIESMPLSELLRTVTAAHEQRTGTVVELELAATEPELNASEKICVFRFVQEGLNNAYRHAGGIGQRVSAAMSDCSLTVTVSDRGGGFIGNADPGSLGLAGLRERVESLGGEFDIESPSGGTRLSMRLRLEEGDT
jgi:signal transduction histidine kinase